MYYRYGSAKAVGIAVYEVEKLMRLSFDNSLRNRTYRDIYPRDISFREYEIRKNLIYFLAFLINRNYLELCTKLYKRFQHSLIFFRIFNNYINVFKFYKNYTNLLYLYITIWLTNWLRNIHEKNCDNQFWHILFPSLFISFSSILSNNSPSETGTLTKISLPRPLMFDINLIETFRSNLSWAKL